MRRVTMTDFSMTRWFWLVFCVLCLARTFVATAPTLRCPNYVDEGEDFVCDCLAPRSTGVMPGVVTWPGRSNTSRLTLHAVSRRDNGTKLTCQLVMMSQLSTKEYTLEVAYGPTDSTVHIEGPGLFVTNGSKVLNLACRATEVNPLPTITWQFDPCNHGTPRVNCSFTPNPLEHDNQTISCRASNLVTRVVSSGYASFTLRMQYPPSDPPSISGHIDGQIHKPGDKLTCTVTGGKPPVSRVIFNCTNPYHKDQEDVITTDKRSSPLDVKSSERQDFETVCTCQAIWKEQPSLYLYKTSISFAISAEFSQEYVTSRCVTSEAYIKESASVTCYFSANLQKSGKSFQLYRNDIDSGNAWSQQQNKYEMVLDCYWLNDGELQCAPMPPGYEFNYVATDKLTVTIPKVSLDFFGRYGCRAQPSHPQEIQHCYVMPKERPETTTTVPAGKKKVADDVEKEGSSNVGGILTGVLVPVVVIVAALIVLFVFRKRVLQLIPWCERQREQKETREDVESGKEINDTVQPLLDKKEGDQTGPPDDSITTKTEDENERSIKNDVYRTNEEYNDSGYVDTLKRQNAASLMKSAIGTRDLHSDIPVSEVRKEEMSCASHHVNNKQDVNSATHPVTERGEDIEKANAEDVNQSAASTNARDGIKQNEAAGTRRKTTSAATNTTLPIAFVPKEIRQISAAPNGGDMQQTTYVLHREKNIHSFCKSETRDEKPTDMKELTGNTGGELTEIPVYTQCQEPKPTEDNERFSWGNVSLKSDAIGDTTSAVPSSQEKESDRWRQTVAEAENQMRGYAVLETEGGALKLMEKTKRDEAHTDQMPQDFHGARAAQNVSCVRDERPNLNARFYWNEIKGQPNGAYIDDIHKQWRHDLDMLESHHSYIQWFFTTSQVPHRNRRAQRLYDYEAKAIREDTEAFVRCLKSYEMMLHFYGLELADPTTGEIQRMHHGWRGRYDNLVQNTHHFLRITRILTRLGEMGLEHYKAPFIRHILLETMQGNLLKTPESCLHFWIETVVDDTEKRELIELFKQCCEHQRGQNEDYRTSKFQRILTHRRKENP